MVVHIPSRTATATKYPSLIERNLLNKLMELGPRNVSEVAFAVGRCSQGSYPRIDFRQPPRLSDEAKLARSVSQEIGVSVSSVLSTLLLKYESTLKGAPNFAKF
ncbi:hypothetical protein Y032_0092g2566 [Ancylostoma ceylanicum]|uniref:Uncharacterized protein n=1 Tax=Ancylostoma ceylanicum TaxID=53326 RepID=A0A016TLW8_9BILA|nr:hypothetical protein Y032_0092g2566 [Ancylostoma ceylanicum]